MRVDEHAFATQNDFVDVEKLLLSASGHTTPAAIWPGYGGGYLVFSGNKSITVGYGKDILRLNQRAFKGSAVSP